MIVQVSVRGFTASSIHQEFLKLSIQRQQVSALCNKPSGTANYDFVQATMNKYEQGIQAQTNILGHHSYS